MSGRLLPSAGGGPHLSLLDCEGIYFSHLTRSLALPVKRKTPSPRQQCRDLAPSLTSLPRDSLTQLCLPFSCLSSLPPTLWVPGPQSTASLASLQLSWAQWASLLTHNISWGRLERLHLEGRGRLRLQYQLLGECLASLTQLSVTGV